MTETKLVKPVPQQTGKQDLEATITSIANIQRQSVEIEAALKQLEEIKPVLSKLVSVGKTMGTVYDSLMDTIGEISTSARLANFKPEEIKPFLKHIWARFPTSKPNEIILALPRFVSFSVGWWDHSDDGYNYFRVNQYTDWLAEVPVDIRKELGLRKPEPLTVQGDMLVATGPVSRDTWRYYKHFLKERVSENAYRIKPRLKYPLAVELVKNGILPYSPQPFPKELIEERPVEFDLQPWQEEARLLFRRYSNIGVYAAPGAGKTFLALRVLCDVKPDPPHLIIMKDRRLVVQWIERIEALTPLKLGTEVVVETFAKALRRRFFEKPWGIVVCDECQDWGADTYSRMAYVTCRGRVGLSGSPFREDGRTELIYAFCGYPYPLPWQEMVKLKGITLPAIHVWFVKDVQSKITKTRELIQDQPNLKTFIYSDHLELGKTLGKVLDAPFIYGEAAPEKSLEVLRNHPIVVVSRVGDRGLSFADIERIIEVDFLYGCYDELTEVLTASGWKRFSEISHKDNIATLNSEGHIEYHKPLLIHSYDYSGSMIHFCGKGYDLLVTPNHNMYVKAQWSSRWQFKQAGDIAKLAFGYNKYELKKDAKWNCADTDYIELPELRPTELGERQIQLYERALAMRGLKSTKEIAKELGSNYFTVHYWFKHGSARNRQLGPAKHIGKIPVEAWLRFLGWYVTEGNIDHGRTVKITQLNASNREEIKQSIADMGLDFTEDDEAIFLFSKQVCQTLIPLGRCAREKRLPSWVKSLPPKRLQVLVDAMVKGDGHTHRPQLHVFYTTSKQLADDFQEIALKCGYATTLSVRQRKLRTAWSKGTYELTEYSVIITRNHTTPEISKKPKTVQYEGKVYCVTVPNHVILVRRNGRAVWCGNSRQQALQRTGRLMHSEYKTMHHILMTPEEYEKYRKRLMAYEGKGLRIDFPNRREFQETLRTRTAVSPRLTLARKTISPIARPSAPIAQIPAISTTIKERLPGVDRTLERLAPVERAVAQTILANPDRSYSSKELTLATGYSPKTIENLAHLGKLIQLGLIKREKDGKYQSAL